MPTSVQSSNDMKFYVLTLAILFIAYIHSSALGARDPYRCNAANTNGQWLDSPESGRSKTPFQKWQPDGCMLRSYSAKAIQSCLSGGDGRDAVFIGDSTVREVFWATARKLNASSAKAAEAKAEKHADVQFQQGKSILTFKWDPFLNSTQLPEYLRASRDALHDPQKDELAQSSTSRAIVVVGGGLWFAGKGSHAVEEFKTAMDRIALPKQPPYHNAPTSPGENRVFFLPVVPPYYDLLDDAHKTTLKAEEIDQMNAYMRDLPATYEVDTLLSFLEMSSGFTEAYKPNGLHVVNAVSDRQAEVILNVRCNNYNREYPYDGTCCYDYPLPWGPFLVIIVGFICFAIVSWVDICDWIGVRG